jgi:hypothetical protein
MTTDAIEIGLEEEIVAMTGTEEMTDIGKEIEDRGLEIVIDVSFTLLNR